MKKNIKEIEISIFAEAGAFAENKDTAKKLRENIILPSLAKQDVITLNYSGVETTTQSFTHALISESIRIYGEKVLDVINFKNCNPEIQGIITIVVEYMQGNMESPIPQD